MEDLLDPLQDHLQLGSFPGLCVAVVAAAAVAADVVVDFAVGHRIVCAALGDVHTP